MKDILIKIDLDNAAFEDDQAGIETSRILERLALRLRSTGHLQQGMSGDLRDINGNTCGTWHIRRTRRHTRKDTE